MWTRGHAGVPRVAPTDTGQDRREHLAEHDADLHRVELREDVRPTLPKPSERNRRNLTPLRRPQHADPDRRGHRTLTGEPNRGRPYPRMPRPSARP